MGFVGCNAKDRNFAMSNNSTTIITGASGGIGSELAAAYLREGHNVVIAGRNAERLSALAEALDAPDRCAIVVGDLRDETVPHRIVETAVSQFGPGLRNVINNAGEFLVKPFLETGAEDLKPFLEMFQNTYLLTQLAVRQMTEQPGQEQGKGDLRGSVVFISTIFTQGFIKQFPCSAVGSIKAAYAGFAKNACFELAEKGIRVNTLDLGVIETPIYGLDDGGLAKLREFQPLNRNGSAAEIADMTTFLTERAPFVTGQVLTVDGGVTAGNFAP